MEHKHAEVLNTMKETTNYFLQCVNADMAYLEQRIALLGVGGVELTRDSFLFNPVSFAKYFERERE